MHFTGTQVSLQQARKLVLLSQHLPLSRFGAGSKAVERTIKQLGYLQIDSISIVSRAHHHTLFNRVNHYRPENLDRLLEQRKVFEYWSHAAAYLPISDFRYCLPRMQAIKAGRRHWYDKNPKIMRKVLERIRSEGPLRAKDFSEHRSFKGNMWQWGPIKAAIECLYMQGDLLVTRRDKFQKVFDLTQRVIPGHIDSRTPSAKEYANYLIRRYLQANGIAHFSDFGHLCNKTTKNLIKQALGEKIESGELIQVGVKSLSDEFYVNADFEQLLGMRLAKEPVKILSPFDNLLIQRKRIKRLFDFDYHLECYLPKDKRQYGYFVLPIITQGRLVARMDAKANRKTGEFTIYHLSIESNYKATAQFAKALYKETLRFAQFNQCSWIRVERCLPESFKVLFSAMGDKVWR